MSLSQKVSCAQRALSSQRLLPFSSLCPGKRPKGKQGGMLGLDQCHCQANSLPNLVMWLSDSVANYFK